MAEWIIQFVPRVKGARKLVVSLYLLGHLYEGLLIAFLGMSLHLPCYICYCIVFCCCCFCQAGKQELPAIYICYDLILRFSNTNMYHSLYRRKEQNLLVPSFCIIIWALCMYITLHQYATQTCTLKIHIGYITKHDSDMKISKP